MHTYLLSSLLSMRSCVWLALVLAEKLMNSGWYSFGILLDNLSEIARVLPVPVGPIHNTCETLVVSIIIIFNLFMIMPYYYYFKWDDKLVKLYYLYQRRFNTFRSIPYPCITMLYSILFSYVIFMFKNCTVTCCLYWHYLGRIKLILILILNDT